MDSSLSSTTSSMDTDSSNSMGLPPTTFSDYKPSPPVNVNLNPEPVPISILPPIGLKPEVPPPTPATDINMNTSLPLTTTGPPPLDNPEAGAPVTPKPKKAKTPKAPNPANGENNGISGESGKAGKFKCSRCEQAFCDKESRRRHEAGHGNKYTCPVCPAGFKKCEGLRRHKLEAHRTEIPTFKCKVCGLGFAHQNSVSRHNRKVHMNIRPVKKPKPQPKDPKEVNNNVKDGVAANANQVHTHTQSQQQQVPLVLPPAPPSAFEMHGTDSNQSFHSNSYSEGGQGVQEYGIQNVQSQEYVYYQEVPVHQVQATQFLVDEDPMAYWMRGGNLSEGNNANSGAELEAFNGFDYYCGPTAIPVTVLKMEDY